MVEDIAKVVNSNEARKAIYLATKLGDKVADWISAFVGSWPCVFLHIAWFTTWFGLRLDVALLTNIVSLEAIFLCIFLLMSQNRQSDRDRSRDDLEAREVDDLHKMQTDLYAINQQQLEILQLLRGQK